MSESVEQQLAALFRPMLESLTGLSFQEYDFLENIRLNSGQLEVTVNLGFPAGKGEGSLAAQIAEAISAAALAVEGVEQVAVNIDWQSPDSVNVPDQPLMAGVRNIVAVASGKGGVGKSTTTVNLALALAQQGAKVGILDADIYGPSQQMMLGLGAKRPEVMTQTVVPNESYGVKSMSMGYLVTEQTPMVWRGPMATGALIQLLFQTAWDELDYLFVDMPPGTGDIQLTLSQKVPVTGAVIVTTPQDIALLDAKKGVEMFNKVNIPVLGVVENMAVHQCSQCGHEEHIFGEGGGARIAQDYSTDLLGALPLALSIRENVDSGRPSVIAEPDSSISQKYHDIARKIAVSLWQQQVSDVSFEIEIADD